MAKGQMKILQTFTKVLFSLFSLSFSPQKKRGLNINYENVLLGIKRIKP